MPSVPFLTLRCCVSLGRCTAVQCIGSQRYSRCPQSSTIRHSQHLFVQRTRGPSGFSSLRTSPLDSPCPTTSKSPRRRGCAKPVFSRLRGFMRWNIMWIRWAEDHRRAQLLAEGLEALLIYRSMSRKPIWFTSTYQEAAHFGRQVGTTGRALHCRGKANHTPRHHLDVDDRDINTHCAHSVAALMPNPLNQSQLRPVAARLHKLP